MDGDTITYYYWPQCYFCQRVTIALNEKNIPHNEKVIRLLKFENFEPEFIKKNPLCLVPVIEDHGNLINESDRIIDYLENKFPETVHLYPDKSQTVERESIEKFKELISNAPLSAIHFGCQLDPEFRKHVKMDTEMINEYINIVRNKVSHLKDMKKLYPQFAEIYDKKIKISQNMNIDKYAFEIDESIENMKKTLLVIEKQLAKMDSEGKKWLCTSNFSVADVYLIPLLHRLDIMGIANELWGPMDKNPQMPHIAKYFKEVMKRPAVIKMIPQYKMGVLGTD